jgi:hypothetical protein
MQGTTDRLKPIILLGLLLTCLLPQPGCVPPTSNSVGQPAGSSTPRALSSHDAAALAARLANDQCERQFQGRRPFSAAQYSAELQDGLYQWGKLDVGGVAGFSAIVTFRQDCTDPHVEVYFSSDTLGIR